MGSRCVFYEVEDIVNPSDVPPFKQLTSMADEISVDPSYSFRSEIDHDQFFSHKNSNLDI